MIRLRRRFELLLSYSCLTADLPHTSIFSLDACLEGQGPSSCLVGLPSPSVYPSKFPCRSNIHLKFYPISNLPLGLSEPAYPGGRLDGRGRRPWRGPWAAPPRRGTSGRGCSSAARSPSPRRARTTLPRPPCPGAPPGLAVQEALDNGQRCGDAVSRATSERWKRAQKSEKRALGREVKCTVREEDAEVALGLGVALLGRPQVPLGRLGEIHRHARPVALGTRAGQLYCKPDSRHTISKGGYRR